jgi:cation diffusion facilitator family transporter
MSFAPAQTRGTGPAAKVAATAAADIPPGVAADVAIRRVLYLALALNLLVAAAKIGFGRFAHFLAIEADGYHSLTDALSSVVALVGAGLALRPPDEDHPYGHRKLEVLAAIVIGLALVGLSVRIAGDVVRHARGGTAHAPAVTAGAFAVLATTLLVNLAVSLHQAREGRRLRSQVLLSDAQHTRSDCWVTGAVLLTAILARLGVPQVDVPAAALVAVIIGKAGVEIVLTNARYLSDAALIAPAQVRRVAGAVAGVERVHTIRSRGTPSAIYLDLRMQVAGHLSVLETAAISRRVEAAIRSELDSVVDVTIHAEPLEATHDDSEALPGEARAARRVLYPSDRARRTRLRGAWRRTPQPWRGLRPSARASRRSRRLPRG